MHCDSYLPGHRHSQTPWRCVCSRRRGLGCCPHRLGSQLAETQLTKHGKSTQGLLPATDGALEHRSEHDPKTSAKNTGLSDGTHLYGSHQGVPSVSVYESTQMMHSGQSPMLNRTLLTSKRPSADTSLFINRISGFFY